MRRQRLTLPAVVAGLLCASAAAAAGGPDCGEAPPAPYPTTVIADYVIGCMLANGTTPETLRKCACSIDFIAAAIPYPEYERVETLLRLQQIPGGGRNAVYKESAWSKSAVAHLREVQAESTLRCFP
jgi:hypothetical protein